MMHLLGSYHYSSLIITLFSPYHFTNHIKCDLLQGVIIQPFQETQPPPEIERRWVDCFEHTLPVAVGVGGRDVDKDFEMLQSFAQRIYLLSPSDFGGRGRGAEEKGEVQREEKRGKRGGERVNDSEETHT
jgi:hypothetical protein